jgi:hypothetical protein
MRCVKLCGVVWQYMGLGAARQCDNLTRSRYSQLCSITVTLGRRHFPHILLPFLLYPTPSLIMFHLMDDTTLPVVECGGMAQVWNNYWILVYSNFLIIQVERTLLWPSDMSHGCSFVAI